MSPRRPPTLAAAGRLQAIQRTFASSSSTSASQGQTEKEKAKAERKAGMAEAASPERFDASQDVSVLFENNQFSRTYVLNRPKALNALNEEMIDLLRPKLEAWDTSDNCKLIVGTGKGRAFCAGGDVRAVVKHALSDEDRSKAAGYFKKEFELDWQLANLRKPYIAVLDGITMGGGLGLSLHAPFRVATENAQFAMPETKIGYAPDVGATFFLQKMDGKVGRYLALTGNTLTGREVYELGLATHFVPSSRIPQLLERLALLNPPDFSAVDSAISEHATEEYSDFITTFVGSKRQAVDRCFGKETVEEIVAELEKVKEEGGELGQWAEETLAELALRSPTALKVALQAQQLPQMTLGLALQVEMRFATAFCNGASPDFITGVKAVLEERIKGRPNWQPATLEEVSRSDIYTNFFTDASPFTSSMPALELTGGLPSPRNPMEWGLPTEEDIGKVIRGEHQGSGAFAITLEELVAMFSEQRGGKAGVTLKVVEVATRRARTKKDGYLQWIH